MTIDTVAALGACTFSLGAFGVVARVAFVHGRAITKLDSLQASVTEIKETIGNGKPGQLVRTEAFEPVAEELARARERIHEHANKLQEYDGRLIVVEMEVNRFKA